METLGDPRSILSDGVQMSHDERSWRVGDFAILKEHPMRLPPNYFGLLLILTLTSATPPMLTVRIATGVSELECSCMHVVKVSKREYDSCSLLSHDSESDQVQGSSAAAVSQSPSALLILNCSSPLHRRRFTILFEPFQSIPNVPEYKPGQSYYFISQ